MSLIKKVITIGTILVTIVGVGVIVFKWIKRTKTGESTQELVNEGVELFKRFVNLFVK